MNDIDVLVVGSVNMDLNATVETLPLRGQSVRGTSFSTAPGGKGANQAVAAARLGAKVAMIGAVGNDEYGPVLRGNLEREGIDTSAVATVDGPSGLAVITIEESGENTLVVVSGANGALTPQMVQAQEDMFRRATVVLVQLETPLDTVLAALKLGRKHGCRTVLNPAPAAKLSDELISQIDIITPNETEAAAVTGDSEPEAAARTLLNKGVGIALITLGKDGSLLADGDDIERIPTYTVKAVDATAAGDAFNGALSAQLATGASLEEALPWGAAAGALAVTVLGAQPSLPERAAVQELMERGK